jgi:HlyD family secretion protein
MLMTHRRATMKRVLPTAAVAAALAVFGFHEVHGHSPSDRFLTARVSAGNIARVVSATGSLQAVETVSVGTQVSGMISELDADFNSIVRRGQVIARLDPSLYKAEIEQARSTLAAAQANVEEAQATLDDAKVKLDAARPLAAKDLITPSDFEDTDLTYKVALSDLQAKKALVVQARGALDQAQVDLANTVIRAPIDGIVVARDVDVGQTVASRYQAPTLFDIAADLSKLQLNATVDESDIGVVKAGQSVTFTVDAYPGRPFSGRVTQVRLQPDADAAAGTAVTYTVVIRVANPDLLLRPGMTPTVTIEVGRHDDVLRVPSAALRWVPTPEMFKASHQAVPPELKAAMTGKGRGYEGSNGYVWAATGIELHAVPVRIGLSDGAFTEVSGAGVVEGMPVVTGEVLVR